MSIRLGVEQARRALVAVGTLTVDSEWCTTTQVAERLGTGTRDAISRLGWLEHLELVSMLGGLERRWTLTDDGRAALEEDARRQGWVPAGQEDDDAAA